MARWLTSLGLGNYRSTQGMESSRSNIGDVRLEEGGVPVDDGFVVQAKKGKRPSPWKALDEADEAAEKGHYALPIAILHRDQRNPGEGADKVVAMRPEVFAALVESTKESSW